MVVPPLVVHGLEQRGEEEEKLIRRQAYHRRNRLHALFPYRVRSIQKKECIFKAGAKGSGKTLTWVISGQDLTDLQEGARALTASPEVDDAVVCEIVLPQPEGNVASQVITITCHKVAFNQKVRVATSSSIPLLWVVFPRGSRECPSTERKERGRLYTPNAWEEIFNATEVNARTLGVSSEIDRRERKKLVARKMHLENWEEALQPSLIEITENESEKQNETSFETCLEREIEIAPITES